MFVWFSFAIITLLADLIIMFCRKFFTDFCRFLFTENCGFKVTDYKKMN